MYTPNEDVTFFTEMAEELGLDDYTIVPGILAHAAQEAYDAIRIGAEAGNGEFDWMADGEAEMLWHVHCKGWLRNQCLLSAKTAMRQYAETVSSGCAAADHECDYQAHHRQEWPGDLPRIPKVGNWYRSCAHAALFAATDAVIRRIKLWRQ